MRYIVTPTFSEKVIRFSGKILTEISQAINLIDQSNKEMLLQNLEVILNEQTDIYVLKISEVRILLSFGNDANGEFALLVDLVVHSHAGNFNPPTSKNPRTNTMVNPSYNTVINPSYNTVINPNYNTAINPNYNTAINPNYNTAINPNYNTVINPNYNRMINPKQNWLINPKQNTAWDGPYLYSLNYNIEGFIIRANDKVALLFEPNGDWIASIINAGEKNYNTFNVRNKWISFLVHNGTEGFNQFSLSNKWNGFIVGEI